MAQILGYLTEVEHTDFQAYAQALGLDASELANLLIIRELKLGRLSDLASHFDQDETVTARTKVTAHLQVEIVKATFIARSASVGMKPTRAAAIIFRAELAERWLEKSVAVIQFDST